MNSLSNNRGLIEAALIATITSFFAIGMLFIPALFLLILLLPVPLIILVSRHGVKYGLYSLIISSLLIGFLTEILFTIFVIILFGPVSLAMGYFISKNHDDFSVIGSGAAISIFTIFLTIQLISYTAGFNIMDEIAILLQEAISNQTEMLQSMNFRINNSQELVNSFMMLFPGAIIIQSMLVAFINYFTAGTILKRLGMKELVLPEFSHFKLPGNIVLGSFLIILLTYFTSFIEGIYTHSLMDNVLLIFMFVFFTQGLAFVSFVLKKIKLYKPLRVAILILIVIISPLLIMVSVLGLIDSLFDLRKLRAR